MRTGHSECLQAGTRAAGRVGAAPRRRPPAVRCLVLFLLRLAASLSPSLFETRTVWSVSGLTAARSASAWMGLVRTADRPRPGLLPRGGLRAQDPQAQGPGALGYQTFSIWEHEGDLTRAPITHPRGLQMVPSSPRPTRTARAEPS